MLFIKAIWNFKIFFFFMIVIYHLLIIMTWTAKFCILLEEKSLAEFLLNDDHPKLLCGLGSDWRRRLWNSLGKKRILQGITISLVSAVLGTLVW